MLRQRRLPARAGDREYPSRAREARDPHPDARRPRARQHARAHALRRLPHGPHAARAPDLPDVSAGKGFRVGITRTYNGRDSIAWRRHASDAGARRRRLGALGCTSPRPRRARARRSSRSGTASRRCRSSRARRRCANGLVGDQALIDRVFERVDSDAGGFALLRATNGSRLDASAPRAAQLRGPPPERHGDALRRPARPDAHARVAIGGRDAEARRALESIGLNVRAGQGADR